MRTSCPPSHVALFQGPGAVPALRAPSPLTCVRGACVHSPCLCFGHWVALQVLAWFQEMGRVAPECPAVASPKYAGAGRGKSNERGVRQQSRAGPRTEPLRWVHPPCGAVPTPALRHFLGVGSILRTSGVSVAPQNPQHGSIKAGTPTCH